MKIELTFEDFKLDEIQEIKIKGGQDPNCPTVSDCTDGDNGCCDERHLDDTSDEPCAIIN